LPRNPHIEIAFSKDIDAIEDMNLVKLIQLSHLFINFQLPRNHREIAEGHNNPLRKDNIAPVKDKLHS
jgi:hypothetical protein